jgi:hypothetical protein
MPDGLKEPASPRDPGGWHDIFANPCKYQVMKVTTFRIAIVSVVSAGLLAFTALRDGSIHGTVSPAEGGVRAWAESYTDTVRAPIVNGSYEIAGLKPGTYKVIIEAKPPYRNAAKDGVMVSDGQPSDAGEIRLQK